MLKTFWEAGAEPWTAFRLRALSDPDALDSQTLLERIEMLAGALHDAGAAAGTPILFSGEQGLPAFLAFWACVSTGSVFVPIDPGWPTLLRQRALQRLQPRLVLVEDDAAAAGWTAAGCAPANLRRLTDADLLAPRARRAARAMPDAAAGAYLFTSGSTAEPKLVVLSRAALRCSARLVVDTFEWQTGETLVNLPDPHTMSGLRNAFLAAPLAGMEWACLPRPARPDVFTLMDRLTELAPQRLVTAPLLMRQLNLLDRRAPAQLFRNLRAVYSTGTDLNPAEVARFHQRVPVPVVNYYGLTETAGLCVGQRPSRWRVDDASLGEAVGCEIRLVDEHGAPTAAAGELQVRQPVPMSGYLDDADESARRFDGDWLRTGDLVRREADGRLTLVGRLGSFIKTPQTERVQPQEIEAVLEQMPGVREAAVFGLSDPAGGERIAALLVGDPSDRPTDAAIAAFVVERLGSARVPAHLRWVAALPRNSAAKITRTRLKDLFDGA